MNILITGGSSGLGKNVVEILSHKEKHKIFFTYNKNDNAAIALKERSNNVIPIKLNFCDENDIKSFLNEIPMMDLDVLINNAYVGALSPTHFHKIEAVDFLNSFQENIIPTIQITQKAIITFKKKRFGKIINILTDYISNPPIGYSTYVSNKAYLLELSKVWNKEYTHYNITSNCVSPSYMSTKFSQFDERFMEHLKQQHPLKKLLTTYEAAEVIAFLTESSQQLNGMNITLNGGK